MKIEVIDVQDVLHDIEGLQGPLTLVGREFYTDNKEIARLLSEDGFKGHKSADDYEEALNKAVPDFCIMARGLGNWLKAAEELREVENLPKELDEADCRIVFRGGVLAGGIVDEDGLQTQTLFSYPTSHVPMLSMRNRGSQPFPRTSDTP